MSRKQVIAITGASAGVGRATAIAFAARNPAAHIALIARGRDGLNGAVQDVEARGSKAMAIVADVANHHQVENAAAEIESSFGPIDIWINNAMASVFSPALEMEPQEFQRVTDVTYLGVVYGTLAALRRMKMRNHGVIVQVGSALAYRSIPLQSAYCAAKHAVAGFTDSLRSELIHDQVNVHLTMVQLPALNTPQFSWVKSRLPGKPQPVPPIFQPEVAAKAIVYAARHHPRELWVAGPTVKAIVGNMFLPGLGDHYLGRTGYDKQQTSEAVEPGRKDNLWQPVPGDHGAHGTFDDRARAHSWELEARIHWWPWAVGAGLGILAGALAASRRKQAMPERIAA